MAPIKKQEDNKLTLVILLFILIVVVIYFFVFIPLSEKKDLNEKKIKQKKVELLELKTMQVRLQKLKNSSITLKDRFSARAKNFSLFTFLDNLAGETNIKSYITYMKPSTFTDKKTNSKISSVEMEIKDIDMDSFFSYIYKVESSKNLVFITKLSIKKKKTTDKVVSIVMQAQTIIF